MIIGVIAHETGHIAGGHIVKRMGEVEDLNVADDFEHACSASPRRLPDCPSAGMGVMMAPGRMSRERNYMSFSRQQEVAADAAAIRFLNTPRINPPAGMLKLFQILRRDETLSYGYARPLRHQPPFIARSASNISAPKS